MSTQRMYNSDSHAYQNDCSKNCQVLHQNLIITISGDTANDAVVHSVRQSVCPRYHYNVIAAAAAGHCCHITTRHVATFGTLLYYDSCLKSWHSRQMMKTDVRDFCALDFCLTILV